MHPYAHRSPVSLLRQAISHHGQKIVASELGCDASKISRFLTGELGLRIDELEKILAFCGITLVEEQGDYEIVDKEELMAYKIIATRKMMRDCHCETGEYRGRRE
jgi:hypothetical protein